MGWIKFSNEIWAGSQPTDEDLQQLVDLGFRAVINVRMEHEKNMALPPHMECDDVTQMGMVFRHCPVSMATLDETAIDMFHEILAAAPRPVFVHCKTGMTSGLLVTAILAVESRLEADVAISEAARAGLTIQSAEMIDLLRRYVRSRQSRRFAS